VAPPPRVSATHTATTSSRCPNTNLLTRSTAPPSPTIRRANRSLPARPGRSGPPPKHSSKSVFANSPAAATRFGNGHWAAMRSTGSPLLTGPGRSAPVPRYVFPSARSGSRGPTAGTARRPTGCRPHDGQHALVVTQRALTSGQESDRVRDEVTVAADHHAQLAGHLGKLPGPPARIGLRELVLCQRLI